MQRDRGAIVIYSGGMDSFTLLGQLLQGGYDLYALSFNYGQRHSKELAFASRVCNAWGIAHREIAFPRMAGSSQTDDSIAVPEGHFADESMKQTVVPNRNMIMLSLAVGYAVSLGWREVFTGVHAGDHAIYPDCRPAFVAAMNQVTEIANYQPVTIQAPYLRLSKGDILREGLALGLDYGQSWTCYNGREKACGKCGACTERLEAFAQNNEVDPLEYEA